MSLSPFFNLKDSYTTPEHRLWFAVLLQYISDLRMHCREEYETCAFDNKPMRAWKRDKLCALEEGGLEAICQLVGIDFKQYRAACIGVVSSRCPYHDPIGRRESQARRKVHGPLPRRLARVTMGEVE